MTSVSDCKRSERTCVRLRPSASAGGEVNGINAGGSVVKWVPKAVRAGAFGAVEAAECPVVALKDLPLRVKTLACRERNMIRFSYMGTPMA